MVTKHPRGQLGFAHVIMDPSAKPDMRGGRMLDSTTSHPVAALLSPGYTITSSTTCRQLKLPAKYVYA